VEGDITDKLGLRTIYEIFEISGGAKARVVEMLGRKPHAT